MTAFKTKSLLEELIATLPDGEVVQACVGLHWTAVAARSGGNLRCGLASTLTAKHEYHGVPDVPQAGNLTGMRARDLAELARAEHPTQSSLGVAAINALLPPMGGVRETEKNAEEVIGALGEGKRVVLVGHFPFVPRLREKVGELTVLELEPRPGDLPAGAAPEVLPQAEVVAITAMTVQNGTLEGLLAHCPPDAPVVLLGATTPLSPLLFERGVDVLCGSRVTDIDSVVRVVGQGGNFRQVHRAGVRLVTLRRPGFPLPG